MPRSEGIHNESQTVPSDQDIVGKEADPVGGTSSLVENGLACQPPFEDAPLYPPPATPSSALPIIDAPENLERGSNTLESFLAKALNPFSRDSSSSSSPSSGPSTSTDRIVLGEDGRPRGSQTSKVAGQEDPTQIERPKSRGANPFASSVPKLGTSSSFPTVGAAPERPSNPRRASNPFGRTSTAIATSPSPPNAEASTSSLSVEQPSAPPLSPLRDHVGESSYASQPPTLVLPSTSGGLLVPTTTVTEPELKDHVEEGTARPTQLRRNNLSSLDPETPDDLPSSNRPAFEAIQAAGITPSPFKKDNAGLSRSSSAFPPQFASHSTNASLSSLPLPPPSKSPTPSPKPSLSHAPPTPTSSTSKPPKPATLPSFKKKKDKPSRVASLKSKPPLESSSSRPSSETSAVVEQAKDSSRSRTEDASESEEMKPKKEKGKPTTKPSSKGKERDSSPTSSQPKHARKGKKERGEEGEEQKQPNSSRKHPRAVESDEKDEQPPTKALPKIVLKLQKAEIDVDPFSTPAAQGSSASEQMQGTKEDAEPAPSTPADAFKSKTPRTTAASKSSSSSSKRAGYSRRAIESDSSSEEKETEAVQATGPPIASQDSQPPRTEPTLEDSKPSTTIPNLLPSASESKKTETARKEEEAAPSRPTSSRVSSTPRPEIKTENSQHSTSTTNPMPPTQILAIEKEEPRIKRKLHPPSSSRPPDSPRLKIETEDSQLHIPPSPFPEMATRTPKVEEEKPSRSNGKGKEKKQLPVDRTKSTGSKSGTSTPTSSTGKAKSKPKPSMDVASLVSGGMRSFVSRRSFRIRSNSKQVLIFVLYLQGGSSSSKAAQAAEKQAK